jgi:hypothetical protein
VTDHVSTAIAQPTHWNVCFCARADVAWVNWLVPGRFKHVRAFGYVPAEGLWIFYDVSLAGTSLQAARDKSPAADALIRAWIDGAEVVRIARGPVKRGMPPGFWCVTAVRHLLGISSGALLPGRLWRDCKRQGGKRFDEDVRAEPAADAGGATA